MNAEYCDQCVCMFVCLPVCMSVCCPLAYLRNHTRLNFTKFSTHASCVRGSVFVLWQCDTLCTSVLWMTSRYHRCRTYSVVCVSVCQRVYVSDTRVRCAKTAEPIDMAFGGSDSCGSNKPCFRWGQARSNPLAADKTAMRPFVKLL